MASLSVPVNPKVPLSFSQDCSPMATTGGHYERYDFFLSRRISVAAVAREVADVLTAVWAREASPKAL
jgi:hypothetical protein